jgi:hypothetical protein
MDVWLLGAGALVLIVISLWIVWPAQSTDFVGSNPNGEEVSKPAMMTPSGEFDDVYTSATADLSAGGVATAGSVAAAMQSMEAAADSEVAPAAEPWSSPTLAREGVSTAYATPATHQPRMPMVPLPVAAIVAIVCGFLGACLYGWWQERNQPINRFRREIRSRVRL